MLNGDEAMADCKLDCEHFELLMSCDLDGELSMLEREELKLHLDACPDCRLRREDFTAVNSWVALLGRADSITATKVAVPSVTIIGKPDVVGPRVKSATWFGFFPHATLAAMAAALLIWLGGFSTGAKQANANDVVAPIVSLARINSTRYEDHAVFKESLELEMRTLLLEIKLLDEEVVLQSDLEEQYEQLLQKIKDI